MYEMDRRKEREVEIYKINGRKDERKNIHAAKKKKVREEIKR